MVKTSLFLLLEYWLRGLDYIVWQDKKAHDFSRGLNCLIKPHVLSATFALTFSSGLQYTF